MAYYLGIDVGTASVRAALVTEQGEIVESAIEPIQIWNPQPAFFEQSSKDIWRAVTVTVNAVMKKSGVAASHVMGLGFDATCSLVALDRDFEPVSCNLSGQEECNIVMWMDHRAEKQAARINATCHSVLQYVGGTMSLEMQPPKLLWLKENLTNSWKKMAHIFDLPDFLTWRATGCLKRSLCSLVCKWGYEVQDVEKHGWNDVFLTSIGLQDLVENDHARIGSEAQQPGELCGFGLTDQAATELGLVRGTPVGASLIDAHAGGVACLACVPSGFSSLPPVTSRLALICGTSTCHMAVSLEPVFVPCVWGPYFSAMIPGLWTTEGGQSSTGRLIDFMVESHYAYSSAKGNANQRGVDVYEYLNTLLKDLAHGVGKSIAQLTSDLHVYPDFHGNRSPLADPTMRGMVCGLSLSATEDDLACLYLATIQALTYGTKHIIDEMNSHGHCIKILYLCGGLRKNSLFVQTHADALGMPVILPDAEESVLLGAAIIGARASSKFAHIQEAMFAMGGNGTVAMPHDSEHKYHEKKYQVYKRMLDDQKSYKEIMTRF